MHFSDYQPMFYNNLPYGSTDDFNEKVVWDSKWTKDSYRLLTRIFLENNSIMTKAYVLMAIKPDQDSDTQKNVKNGAALIGVENVSYEDTKLKKVSDTGVRYRGVTS